MARVFAEQLAPPAALGKAKMPARKSTLLGLNMLLASEKDLRTGTKDPRRMTIGLCLSSILIHLYYETNIIKRRILFFVFLEERMTYQRKGSWRERDNYEENAANHFQPQALSALTVEDYNNAPSYIEQIAFDHFQPQALTATTTGDYIYDPRYKEENAANHFQPQEHYSATTGDYGNAHWYTKQNAADHFEPHDETHNATNEDLTTALRRMEEILMSGF
ncbi:hypothetical protein ACFX19_031587 [Malus domestica]